MTCPGEKHLEFAIVNEKRIRIFGGKACPDCKRLIRFFRRGIEVAVWDVSNERLKSK